MPERNNNQGGAGNAMKTHRLIALIAFCSLAGSVTAAPKLDNIPLKWQPSESLGSIGPLDLSGPLIVVKVHIDKLVDTRQNPSAVGENREKPDRVLPVTTSSDVAEFVTDRLKETLRGANVNIVEGPGDVNLSGEIRQYFVTETNLYHGDLSILMHAKNAEGKEIWSGALLGGAEHFGRSYKADNYYESLSDSIVRAAYNLLTNQEFRQALKQ
jgi:hypothetical protein